MCATMWPCVCSFMLNNVFVFISVWMALLHCYWLKESCSCTSVRKPPPAVLNLFFFSPFSISSQESMCKLIHSAEYVPYSKPASIFASQASQHNWCNSSNFITHKAESCSAKCKMSWGASGFRNDYVRVLSAWTVRTADHRWLIGSNHTAILSECCALQII